MTKITREDVLRVAELAHLDLTEAEVETFGRQIDSILTYADTLNQLDTANVEPMAHVAQPGAKPDASPDAVSRHQSAAGTPLRDDTPVRSTVVVDILRQAPDAAAPYFRVPKVIDR